jgi:hypothetical protein
MSSRVTLEVDKELIKEYRDYKIDSVLDEVDDSDFECFLLNKVFERNPNTKERVMDLIQRFDVVMIDVGTATITEYYDRRNVKEIKLKGLMDL